MRLSPRCLSGTLATATGIGQGVARVIRAGKASLEATKVDSSRRENGIGCRAHPSIAGLAPGAGLLVELCKE
jgi:hypothetical protein